MEKITKKIIDSSKRILSEVEITKIESYFNNFNEYCLIELEEKEKLEEDIVNVVIYYLNNDKKIEEILNLIDLKYFGDFYCNLTKKNFELDDAAKSYSFSISYKFMPMFRLVINLKEEIVPELLQMALNFTIKRFLSFATALKKGFFWYYLEVSKKHYYIELEDDKICQPIDLREKEPQLFRILYKNKHISIEFSHLLTDGTGAVFFLKVLLTEYLRLMGIDISNDENIIDSNSNIDPEELENAFEKVPMTKKYTGLLETPAVQLGGKLSKNRPCDVINYKLDSNKLKLAAKKHNTTVTGYLLALMFIAGKSTISNSNGKLGILLPVNIRKLYSSKSVRNFSIYCRIRLPIKEINDIKKIIPIINSQLKEKTSKELMINIINATKKTQNLFTYSPLITKRIGAKKIYGYVSSSLTSTVLSNLGVIEVPNFISNHIENIESVLNTTVYNRVACSVITINNITTFSISKMTENTKFEEKLYELFYSEQLIKIDEE